MGLKYFCTKTARLPAFLFRSTLLILTFLNRKSIFRTALLISLTITIAVFVYGITSSINSENANTYCKEINIDRDVEDINTLIIPENNHLICDSLTGTCGPPSAWYSTNN